jgi:hypothetical protein
MNPLSSVPSVSIVAVQLQQQQLATMEAATALTETMLCWDDNGIGEMMLSNGKRGAMGRRRQEEGDGEEERRQLDYRP